jgi:Glucodextranase, domain B
MKQLSAIGTTAVACIATGVVTLAISGCGSSSPSVHVQVLAPTDGSSTSADRVTVRGTVTPTNATVQVAGQSAQVGAGVFTTSVPLQPGANQLDVIASAPGGAPASTMIAVTRKGAPSVRPASSQQSQSVQSSSSAPSSSSTPSSSSASSGSPASSNSPEGTNCGGDLHAGQGTSCTFAENVRNAYNEAPGAYLQVYSPVTERTYSMDCTPVGAGVSCNGGNEATVSW